MVFRLENIIIRIKKKDRKKNKQLSRGLDSGDHVRQASVPEWRVGAGPSNLPGVGRLKGCGVHVGAFDGLSEDIKLSLKETRARLLIAENERKLKEIERRDAWDVSPMALMKTVMATVSMAERLKKTTADAQIGGWAATVASSAIESVARSAPSSVPSLEEIGLGKSALSCGSSEDSALSARRIEYTEKVTKLKDDLDLGRVECYDEVRLFANLRDEYKDVAYTDDDKLQAKLIEALESSGVPADKSYGVLRAMGVPVEEVY